MRRILLGLAVGAAMTAPAFAEWQRQGQTTGPRGNSVHSQGQGSCAGGTCEWTRQSDGPRGNSASTKGSAVRTAPGEWSGTSTTTGSGGRTATHQGTVHVRR